MPEPPETIAAGYLRYVRDLRRDQDPDAVWDPESDPNCGRYKIVGDTVRHGPPHAAWRLVRAVLDATPDDELGITAAGPLEDLVRLHGSALLEVIERAAADDDRFQWALGKIWLSEADLPTHVLDRIVRASAGQLKVLERLPKQASMPTPPNER